VAPGRPAGGFVPEEGNGNMTLATAFCTFTSPPWREWPSLGSESFARMGSGEREEPESENEFAKLARLVRSNDRLLKELRALRPRMVSARAYLTELGCHVELGQMYLQRLQDRRSRALSGLRANRIEARELLASLGD